jgi:hypothetical protein
MREKRLNSKDGHYERNGRHGSKTATQTDHEFSFLAFHSAKTVTTIQRGFWGKSRKLSLNVLILRFCDRL